MKCKKAIRLLSPLLDERLDGTQAGGVSAHLEACSGCRTEWKRLVDLRERMRALGGVSAPSYLRHLFELRLQAAEGRTWRSRLCDMLEYRLSLIRTAGGMWYWTRLAGTAMTCLFFLAISTAVTPGYFDLRSRQIERDGLTPEARYQLVISVLKNLGLTPVEAQKRPIRNKDPQIHDLYLLHFSQNASRISADDSFSVVTVIDRSGTAKIEGILEYPEDESLLEDFNAMLTSARCRPASQNGRAVDGHLVMNFSKIAVYE